MSSARPPNVMAPGTASSRRAPTASEQRVVGQLATGGVHAVRRRVHRGEAAALEPEAALRGQRGEREALRHAEAERLGHGLRPVGERVAIGEQGDAHAVAGEVLDGQGALEGRGAAAGDEQALGFGGRHGGATVGGRRGAAIVVLPQSDGLFTRAACR